jgi:hypothetical protein
MSLALKINVKDNSGKNTPVYIYFDAVTVYNRTFQSAVSKHPISDGNVISDHTTSENQMISFTGIISDSDLESNRPMPYTDADKYYVVLDSAAGITQVKVVSEKSVTDFLPSSITQFLSNSVPEIEMQQSGELRQKDMRNSLLAARNSRELVTLVEYDHGVESNVHTNLAITGLSFDENADSGDALFVAISLEEVKYVSLSKATIPAGAIVVNADTGKGAENKNSAAGNVDQGIIAPKDLSDSGWSPELMDARDRVVKNDYGADTIQKGSDTVAIQYEVRKQNVAKLGTTQYNSLTKTIPPLE